MAKAIKQEPCDSCGPAGDGAGDNLITHEDGSQHCYACGYHYDPNAGSNFKEQAAAEEQESNPNFLTANECVPLNKHCITKATCERLGVYTTYYEGYFKKELYKGPVIVFPFYAAGKLVAQKIKTPDKRFKWISSSGQQHEMFLSHTYNSKNKKLFITEGEEDAMALAQTLGPGPYQITSLDKGAGSISNFVDSYREVLDRYEKLVTVFDSDEPGRQAAQEFLNHFCFGKVAVVNLSEKDACDMLKAGKDNDLKWACLTAEAPKPKTSVTITDIIDKVKLQPKAGVDWPWKFMTDITYGRRKNEIIAIAAASGVGKTTVITEIVYDALAKGSNVGLCSLEQRSEDTVQRLIGHKLNKQLHLPGHWWDQEAIEREAMALNNKLFLYDKTKGDANLEAVINTFFYWVNTKKCDLVILDNLTALCHDRTIDGKRVSENEFLSYIATKFFTLVKGQLNCTLILIAHLNKSHIGKSAYISTSKKAQEEDEDLTAEDMDKMINKPGLHWESGRIPRLEDINGGSHLDKLADFVFALGRNRTSEDDTEKRILRMKALKCGRMNAANEGRVGKIIFNPSTGHLEELITDDII